MRKEPVNLFWTHCLLVSLAVCLEGQENQTTPSLTSLRLTGEVTPERHCRLYCRVQPDGSKADSKSFHVVKAADGGDTFKISPNPRFFENAFSWTDTLADPGRTYRYHVEYSADVYLVSNEVVLTVPEHGGPVPPAQSELAQPPAADSESVDPTDRPRSPAQIILAPPAIQAPGEPGPETANPAPPAEPLQAWVHAYNSAYHGWIIFAVARVSSPGGTYEWSVMTPETGSVIAQRGPRAVLEYSGYGGIGLWKVVYKLGDQSATGYYFPYTPSVSVSTEIPSPSKYDEYIAMLKGPGGEKELQRIVEVIGGAEDVLPEAYAHFKQKTGGSRLNYEGILVKDVGLPALPHLVRAFRQCGNPNVAEELLGIMREIDKAYPAKELLPELLAQEDVAFVAYILRWMPEEPADVMADHALMALCSQTEFVRLQAAMALAKFNTEEVLKQLKQRARMDPSACVRFACACAVRAIKERKPMELPPVPAANDSIQPEEVRLARELFPKVLDELRTRRILSISPNSSWVQLRLLGTAALPPIAAHLCAERVNRQEMEFLWEFFWENRAEFPKATRKYYCQRLQTSPPKDRKRVLNQYKRALMLTGTAWSYKDPHTHYDPNIIDIQLGQEQHQRFFSCLDGDDADRFFAVANVSMICDALRLRQSYNLYPSGEWREEWDEAWRNNQGYLEKWIKTLRRCDGVLGELARNLEVPSPLGLRFGNRKILEVYEEE